MPVRSGQTPSALAGGCRTIKNCPRGNIMNMPARALPSSRPSDSLRGLALLRDPLLNRGTAFTEAERDALGVRGLLPAHVLSMDEQVGRIMTNLRDLPSDLEKYVALNTLL